MTDSLRSGERVRVRSERWRIARLVDDGGCQLVTLRGLGPANLDDERTLIASVEVIDHLQQPAAAKRTGRKRWRSACRGLLAAASGWSSLRCADTAAVDVLPYQLAAALSILRGETSRVLLADAVGLGKTIQAGLVVAELLARGIAQRALFLTPAGLRDQWAGELLLRFGQRASIVDAHGSTAIGAMLPPGDNPWNAVPVAIASVDYVKRPEVLPFVRSRPWDVIVVDEAHIITPDSDRYRAVADLCDAALFVILSTATPHSGDRHAFEALCALGRRDRDDRLLVFQRSRADINAGGRRRIHRLTIRPSRAEKRMFAALERYAAAILQSRGRNSAGLEAESALLVTILRKRALSSPEALRQSVERRLRVLVEPGTAAAQLALPLDDEGETDADDLAPVLSKPVLRDVSRERQLLQTVLDAATVAVPTETKVRVLGRMLRRLRRLGEPAVVFTEYRDTLMHLERTLDIEAVLLHGGLSRGERRHSLEDFTTGGSMLLLATDAGGEGLNLHQRCRVVVHLELPWNPSRLEQRTGRVDRIAQQRTVHAYYLVARHSTETRMLSRLRMRIGRARRDIKTADPFEPSTPRAVGADERERVASMIGLEARRIELSRRLRARGIGDPPAPGSCWLMRARTSLRARLAGQTLLVLAIDLESSGGCSAGGSVIGLLVDAALSDSMLERAKTLAVERVLRLVPGEDYVRFGSLALERARQIEKAATAQAHLYFQPGLFDRRAARLRHVLAAEQHRLADDLALRVKRLARFAAPVEPVVRSLLLVVPQ